MVPIVSAFAIFLLTSVAEWLHVRRIRAVGRLAFGPSGRAYGWTGVVPWLRALCLSAFTWGLATLMMLEYAPADAGGKGGADKEATRVIFVADLSPSMYLVDAGKEGTQSRHARMKDVVDAILQRVSGNLRFGVIAFYTESLPVVMEARDPELVRNVFNGLPISYTMPLGQTNLGKAVNDALKHVAEYPEGSTRMVILTDGDSVGLEPIAVRPKSVKEIFILGIGNPHKGTFIDGHLSRQEVDTLRLVSTDLMATYMDVNEKHLPTNALGDLVVTMALPSRGLTLSEWAVLAMVLSALIYALIPVALEYFGSDWKVIRAEREEASPAKRAKEGALATR
jgi:Ca-activated chloride channel family protein